MARTFHTFAAQIIRHGAPERTPCCPDCGGHDDPATAAMAPPTTLSAMKSSCSIVRHGGRITYYETAEDLADRQHRQRVRTALAAALTPARRLHTQALATDDPALAAMIPPTTRRPS